MKMPDAVAEGFAQQATTELASSAAYLQMAIYFADRNLTGMSSWMRAQSAEERDHAMRFLDFLIDRGHRPDLGPLLAPTADFADAEAVFAAALEQENEVTRAIHELHALALDAGDLASLPFLLEFVSEQTEEEAMVEGILNRLQLANGDPSAILLIDQEVGSRASG